MAGSKEMKIAIKIGGMVEASLQKAASKAASCLGSVTKSAARTAKIATAAGAAATAVIGKAAVDVGKEFETAMSSAAATADATPAQFKKMEDAARKMGRATSKTAAESAAALEYMALAGWDVDTSISALPSVLKMSEASGMELARTSDLITDSMSALGVSIDELPSYLDVAAKAQNKSNQTAEQLMEAYLGVGGTMNNLGVPITESATALGVLANRGIKGSEAGNALNAVMINLTTGTGQAGEMMSKLGISAFDSSGKFIGLTNTLQQVNAALSGCTEEERNAALAAIGGKQHVDALNNLMAGLNTTNEKGITEWAALTGELENCDGALAKMAARKMDNLEGDLAILNSAMSDLGISIYKDMNTPLRDAVQLGTKMAETLSKGYSSGGMQGMAASIGTSLADAADAVTAAMPSMVTAGVGLVQNFISGISQNTPALTQAAAQAAGGFASGMGAVLPQFFLLSMDLITGFVQGITAQMPQMIISGARALAEFASGFSQRLPEMVQAGLELIQTISSSLMDNGPQLLAAAVQITGVLAAGFAAAVPQLAQTGAEMLNSLASGISSNVPQMIPAAMNALVEFSGTLRGSAGQLVDAGLHVVMALADSLVTNLPVLIQTVPTIIINLCGIINDNAPKLLTAGAELVKKLWNGIVQSWPVIVENFPKIIEAAVAVFEAFNWANLGKGIINAIKKGISIGSKVIPKTFKSICTKAKEFIKKVDWKQTGTQVIKFLVSGVKAAASFIWKAFKTLGKSAVKAVRSINWLDLGIKVIKAIAFGVKSYYKFMFKALKGLWGVALKWVKGVNWKDLGIKIIKGIIKGIASTGRALWKTVKGLFLGKKEKAEIPVSVEAPKTKGKTDTKTSIAGREKPAVQAKTPILEKAKAEPAKAEVPEVQTAPVMEAKAKITDTRAADTAGTKALETGVRKESSTGKISLSNVKVDARPLNAAMDSAGRKSAKRLKTGLQREAGSAKVNLNKVKVNAKPLASSMKSAGKRGASALNTEITNGASKAARTTKKLGTDINRQMDEAWTKMQTQARMAMNTLCTIVTQDAQRTANAVRTAFETMVIRIPEPKLPEIKVTRHTVSYGGGAGRSQGSVEIPKFTTVWHAQGGIFKKPTLFGTASGAHGVGESGPEAVLPLNLLWQRLEDTMDEYGRGWVDKLLDRLSRLDSTSAGQDYRQMQPVVSEGAFVFNAEYNPTYNINGNAPGQDVTKADRTSQKEFKKWFEKEMKEYQKELERRFFRPKR